jgi:DNA helicase II / ATP-dependent DNA helicase PcrA
VPVSGARNALHHFGGLGSFEDLEDELAGTVESEPVEDHTDSAPPETEEALGGASTDRTRTRARTRARWRDSLPAPDELLEGLNEPQRRAVLYRGGPLLVVAGAGSGKTRALTHRVAHLIATGDALPWEILAITFTNKAADEMRERLVGLIGPVAERMWVSTFHAACVRILRSHADRLGYRRSFTVYDDADSLRLVEHVLRDLNIDAKKIPPRSVQAAISGAKAELVQPQAFKAAAANVYERRMADVYVEYQNRLVSASAMDFDDLLSVTVELLRRFPDVLEGYQERFKQVLVDEYQDTNRAQNEIVLLIGAAHRNVTVVGDTDQAIYGWRSADIRNILEFEEQFPDAAVIPLEQNYRSTRTILDAANAVISNNTTRVPKELWTTGATGEPVTRYRAEDEHDEADWVASEIVRLHNDEGLSFGDVAVFYRTNAQSRTIEEALVHQEIPYRVVGGTRFYDRREIKDVLAYLRVVANPSDEVSARRIVNVPRRGIGDASVERLAAWARSNGVSFFESLDNAAEAGVSGRALKGIASLRELIDRLRSMQESGSGPAALVDAVAERTGYRAALEEEDTLESLNRLENIDELQGAAGEYDELDEFLESVALVSDVDEMDQDTDRASLMTLHTAKGLEFPAVFLVGMEDGIFPHLRSLDDPLKVEEERRLAYVGITRAKRHLYVSHAWSRTLWGTTSHAIPSRFLSELPNELVRDVGGSWLKRPDALRAGYGSRRDRVHEGAWSHDGGFDDTSDTTYETVSGETSVEDFHDPDPWGDSSSTSEPSYARSDSSSSWKDSQSAVDRVDGRRRSPPRRDGGPVRGAGRRSRLPKMAEERLRRGEL